MKRRLTEIVKPTKGKINGSASKKPRGAVAVAGTSTDNQWRDRDRDQEEMCTTQHTDNDEFLRKKRPIRRRHFTKKNINLGVPPVYTKYKQYPKITNYVCTVNLGVSFNLRYIAMYMCNSFQEPEQFAALHIKVEKTTCLLFTTGKIVVTGAKTFHGSILAAHMYRLILEKIKQPVYVGEKGGRGSWTYGTLEKVIQFTNFKVINIVGNNEIFPNLDKPKPQRVINVHSSLLNANKYKKSGTNIVNLDSMASGQKSIYEPDTFPGLRTVIKRSPECPIQKPSMMAYIFSETKVVLMGGKVEEDIYIGNEYLRKTVEPYLINNNKKKKPLNDLAEVLALERQRQQELNWKSDTEKEEDDEDEESKLPEVQGLLDALINDMLAI